MVVQIGSSESMLDEKAILEAYDNQAASLLKVSATTVDPCLVAKYIAIADERVRALFAKKLLAGDVFRGVECAPRSGTAELITVVFEFDCKPGVFCFISPSFAVVVNLHTRHVVSVLDPYVSVEAEEADFGPGGIPILTLERSVSIGIDVDTRFDAGRLCVKVKLKIHTPLGNGSVSLPEVCLGADGVCTSVTTGNTNPFASAQICWRGSQVCVDASIGIKIGGRKFEASGSQCFPLPA